MGNVYAKSIRTQANRDLVHACCRADEEEHSGHAPSLRQDTASCSRTSRLPLTSFSGIAVGAGETLCLDSGKLPLLDPSSPPRSMAAAS